MPKPATPVPAAQPAPSPWKSAVPAASLLHIQSQQGAAATVLGQAASSAPPAAPAASPAPKGIPGGSQQSRASGGEPELRYSLSAVSAAAVGLCVVLRKCRRVWGGS